MKKLYCIICSKYRKFEQSKTSYIFKKALVLSVICSKYKNELYVLMMSRTRFRVNPHSIVA